MLHPHAWHPSPLLEWFRFGHPECHRREHIDPATPLHHCMLRAASWHRPYPTHLLCLSLSFPKLTAVMLQISQSFPLYVKIGIGYTHVAVSAPFPLMIFWADHLLGGRRKSWPRFIPPPFLYMLACVKSEPSAMSTSLIYAAKHRDTQRSFRC